MPVRPANPHEALAAAGAHVPLNKDGSVNWGAPEQDERGGRVYQEGAVARLQVYAVIYDGERVLVATKHTSCSYFEGKETKRTRVNGGGKSCFPGGRKDKADALPIDSALREFEEETGYQNLPVSYTGRTEKHYIDQPEQSQQKNHFCFEYLHVPKETLDAIAAEANIKISSQHKDVKDRELASVKLVSVTKLATLFDPSDKDTGWYAYAAADLASMCKAPGSPSDGSARSPSAGIGSSSASAKPNSE